MQLGGVTEVDGGVCCVGERDITPSGLRRAAALVGRRVVIELVWRNWQFCNQGKKNGPWNRQDYFFWNNLLCSSMYVYANETVSSDSVFFSPQIGTSGKQSSKVRRIKDRTSAAD
jgi:hypothetical protein